MSVRQRLNKLSAKQKSKRGGFVIFKQDLERSHDGELLFTCEHDPDRLYTDTEIAQYEQDHGIEVIKILYTRSSAHWRSL